MLHDIISFLGSLALVLLLIGVYGVALKYGCKYLSKLLAYVGDAPMYLIGAATTFATAVLIAVL